MADTLPHRWKWRTHLAYSKVFLPVHTFPYAEHIISRAQMSLSDHPWEHILVQFWVHLKSIKYQFSLWIFFDFFFLNRKKQPKKSNLTIFKVLDGPLHIGGIPKAGFFFDAYLGKLRTGLEKIGCKKGELEHIRIHSSDCINRNRLPWRPYYSRYPWRLFFFLFFFFSMKQEFCA